MCRIWLALHVLVSTHVVCKRLLWCKNTRFCSNLAEIVGHRVWVCRIPPPPRPENEKWPGLQRSPRIPPTEHEKVLELDGEFKTEESQNTPLLKMKKIQNWMASSKIKGPRIPPCPPGNENVENLQDLGTRGENVCGMWRMYVESVPPAGAILSVPLILNVLFNGSKFRKWLVITLRRPGSYNQIPSRVIQQVSTSNLCYNVHAVTWMPLRNVGDCAATIEVFPK